MRDAFINAELLADRRRHAAERQREKNKRDLVVLSNLRNEAGRLKRSVIHQIEVSATWQCHRVQPIDLLFS